MGFLEALIAIAIGVVTGLAWLFRLAGSVKLLETTTADLKQQVNEADTLVRDVTTKLAVIETKLKNTDEKLDLIRTDIASLAIIVRKD
tara:strand:+ start:3766 stop:4029 length:264 start_codon:yes stop_codon:yes gene_type:complete